MNKDKKRGARRKGQRWISGILGLACMASLSGCSLAVPEAGEDREGDRLIGAFITAEYLDLYDIEGYLEDHGNLPVDGGEVTLPHDSKYEGRLYAQIDESKGPYDWEISFGDVSGEYMLYVQQPGEEEPCRMCLCTDGVSDINTGTNISDDSEEYSISGTMYVLSGQTDDEAGYHVNPVYQTAEGEIYAVSGQGFFANGEAAEGAVFSTTLSGEKTLTENGKAKTEKDSVTVSYAIMNRPVQITLYQMDQAHRIVKQDVYEPGKAPETLTADRETEYILVETDMEDRAGKRTVSREVVGYDPDGETFLDTFYALDSGIMVKGEVEVIWGR